MSLRVLAAAVIGAACGGVVTTMVTGSPDDAAPGSLTRSEIAQLESDLKFSRQRESDLEKRLEVAKRRAQRAESQLATAGDGSSPVRLGGSDADDLEPAPVAELSAAQQAAIHKKRRDEIKTRLPSWVADKDGKSLIKALRELQAMGPEAYPLIIEIANIVNRDMFRGGNTLNIKMQDYYISFPPEINAWALSPDNFDAAGPEFRIHAAHGLMWTQTPDKDKLLIAAIARETEKFALDRMAGVLHHRPDAESGEAIIEQLRNNPAMAQENKNALMKMLTQMPGEAVDLYLQEQLTLATDEATRESLSLSLKMRNPKETGYMVSTTFPDTQAAALGLKPGDIIVSYGGQKLSDVSLGEAKNKASGETVTVEIYRDGNYITVQMAPGTLGVDGSSVVKQ